MLKVSDIDAYYGSLQVLWDVSIEVKTGETVAIIGANGSGKSTLMNSISGIMHPVRGSIMFDGMDITMMDPYQIVTLGISQVPEGRRIFPDMTVYENLRLGAYNHRARPKREQSFENVYQHFPILEKRKKQLAKTMSGGEQQMMAIGSALMSDPKLLLLDEMSLGLSPIVVNELYYVLKEIRSKGITIIFVEQNVRRTLEEAERAYILETGHVVLSGSAESLRAEEKVKKAYFGA
ncbi:MAG: ABC transporter ATP-binding protein [Deltaproteobacteria bacterium]|nr:ABC transporter ATP-binding protein [Deltaproteobacteria bacterium]